ncbi:MAG: NHL repeat-containing protein, partial [Anaerolineales bacterium]|nr:NHL repeat-containing protein [Anaerolineales bacterium]
EPIVGQAYYRFDYIRLWWPNQDYFNLTFERIKDAIIDPQMRTALIKIWLYRDYTLYAQLTEQNITLDNWYPSDRMRLYIRKDVVAQLWDYGTTIAPDMVVADPYEGKQMDLTASKVIGAIGTEPGQLQNPRDVAIAPDGSLYIADTNNHRIQHVTQDGAVLHVWGSFADVSKGAAQAPGGTFYEPWAVAVGIDGSVYVADTWNHRIQHFTAEGEFINTWGYFGTADTPFAIWGPRDIAIDPKGHVYVTDTGNKRVVIYDAMGNFINQFGSAGYGPGQLDEPVGIAVDNDSVVYIADTWNQRIQVMSPDGVGGYSPLYSLDLVAWYGQSLENKPYIAVDSAGNVFITDPEGYRVLRFNNRQEFAYYWGDFGFDLSSFNIPNGLFADAEGNLWVADSGNHRILRFSYTR